ncbi:uncharacterized protein ACN2A1_007105 isoform 1-T3 [Glossina fuscipes fuscipes]
MDNGNLPSEPKRCRNSSYGLTVEDQEKALETNAFVDSLSDLQSDVNMTALALPNEIWIIIFNNLSYEDVMQASLVCKEWCQLIRATVLRDKTRLVITQGNLRNICELVGNQSLNYESVEVDEKWNVFNNAEVEFLRKIFKYSGSIITKLKLYRTSTTAALLNFLPKLKELDLSDANEVEIERMDISKFPNLKSAHVLKYDKNYSRIYPILFTDLPRISTTSDEILTMCIDIYSVDLFNMLERHSSSLRCLNIRLCPSGSLALRDRLPLQETFRKLTHLEELNIADSTIVDRSDNEFAKIVLESLPKESRIKTILLGHSLEDEQFLELIIEKWFISLARVYLFNWIISENTINRFKFLSGKYRLTFSIQVGDWLDFTHWWTPYTNKNSIDLKLFFLYLTPKRLWDLFKRLPNVTALEVKRLIFSTNDEVMGYVFHHLTNLRHLSLHHSWKHRTNIKYLCSKPRISNLKRLQTLRSCLCPIKVLKIFKSNFQFKELTKFELLLCERFKRISLRELEIISTYVPALEEFCSDGLDYNSNYLQEMRRIFPRLRRLNDRRLF